MLSYYQSVLEQGLKQLRKVKKNWSEPSKKRIHYRFVIELRR